MDSATSTDRPLESDATRALEGLHDDIDFTRTRSSVLQRIFGGAREPTRIDRFEVIGFAGDGAMGRVYVAYDPELDRTVALKMIRASGLDVASTQKRQQRLVREAKALARLSHPHVISVYEVGEWQGDAFIVMAYVPGPDLRQWIAARSPSLAERLRMLISAGRGLAAAHAANLIHRDFKPENIVVAGPGDAIVLDFGVAVASEEARDTIHDLGLEGLDPADVDTRLTQTGAAIGTPAYMAPEHHHRGISDERSDQYSFCVTAYEALTGERPMREKTAELWHGPGGGLPREFQQAIERGLSKDPAKRWPSVEALLDQLERDPRRREKRALGVALALAGVVGVYFAQQAKALPACTASEQAAVFWNEARASSLEKNLSGLDAPYAEHVAQGVVKQVGSWTHVWEQERVRACEERRARLSSVAMHDKWVHCLDRRTKELDALLAAWTTPQPDAKVLNHVKQAIRKLKSPTLCGDSSWMAAALEPPADAAEQAQVESLRLKLDATRALIGSGRFAEALDRAKGVVEEARELDYPPVLAESLFLLGRAHGFAGEWKAGEAPMFEAHLAALASSYDQLAPDIATELTFVVGYYGGRSEEGLNWARIADAEAQRLHGSWPGRARLLRNEAVLWSRQGEYEKAITLLDEAILLNPSGRANYELNRGHAFADMGRYEEARSAYESALALSREELGEAHPKVGHHLHSLGGLFDSMGKHEEAARYFQAALDNRELSLGPDHPHTAQSMLMLGATHWNLGANEEALVLQREAMQRISRELGEDHPRVAPFHSNLGNTLSELDRLDEAEEHHRRALAIMIKESGEESPTLALIYGNLGSVVLAREDYAGALELFTTALALREQAVGPESSRLVFPLSGLGASERALGHLELSSVHYTRIIGILQGGDLHPTVLAKAHVGLAEIAWAQGRYEDARKHAQDAGKSDSEDAKRRSERWLDAHAR